MQLKKRGVENFIKKRTRVRETEEFLTENLKEQLNDEDLRPNLGGFLIKLFK